MKKILLIALILLLKSFPSFGNPYGKGIICGCYFYKNIEKSLCKDDNLIAYHHLFAFFNKEGVEYRRILKDKKDDQTEERIYGVIIRTQHKLNVNEDFIFWKRSKNTKIFALDRKTLKLREGKLKNEKLFLNEVYRNCKVYKNKKLYDSAYFNLRKELKKKLINNREKRRTKNKI